MFAVSKYQKPCVLRFRLEGLYTSPIASPLNLENIHNGIKQKKNI